MKIIEIAKIEVVSGQRIGEKPRIESFLAAEADALEFRVAEFQEIAWRERADGILESIESGFRGCQGNLLLEHDVDECRETGFANPQRRRPVLLDDFPEMGVALRQETHALSEDVFVQNDL